MALTRKMLKAMGIEDEKIDQIIDAHTETVDALKEKVKVAEEKAGHLDSVEKELNDLKAQGNSDYKSKYEDEHKAFEKYKKEQDAKAIQALREAAAKKYFESKNITGANLEIAMRGARDEIAALEMDGDNIKDSGALESLVKGTFAGLVVTNSVQGAATATPPANIGGGKMTKADIFKKDDKGRYVMSADERQRAIAENLNLFKKG